MGGDKDGDGDGDSVGSGKGRGEGVRAGPRDGFSGFKYWMSDNGVNVRGTDGPAGAGEGDTME